MGADPPFEPEAASEVRELPMFPLGSVLFPHGLLPLQVFEPRYRLMMEHVLAGDQRFGVVLIERGSEVGGGDVRFDVGTVARIARVSQAADGRLLVATVGTRRLRVQEWLPDEPYPRARVRLVTEAPADITAIDGRSLVEARLREVFDLWGEMDPRARALPVELSTDPLAASFEACALAPIGPLDAQRLLELDDTGARLTRLAEHLAEEIEVLRFRLQG